MLQRKHRVASGFTVVELLVVLGIMSILAAIVTPRWEEYRSRMIVGEATNTFCTAFREARDEALLEQCEMNVMVNNNNHRIDIYRYNNNTNLELYRQYRFSDKVFVGGTGELSIIVGRGGRITAASGITSNTSSVAGYAIPYYDIVCNSQESLAEDHIYLTLDGRASIGASL